MICSERIRGADGQPTPVAIELGDYAVMPQGDAAVLLQLSVAADVPTLNVIMCGPLHTIRRKCLERNAANGPHKLETETVRDAATVSQ